MSLKSPSIEIAKENPFANCKLDRKKYSAILTEIINIYDDGFVLAINNQWGTGKSTFVKMWEQELKNNHYQTVFFNAWENDFEDNPLTALMGELKSLTNEKTKPKFQKALKNAAVISKNITPILAQAIVDKYLIDTKGIKEVIVAATKGVNEIFENEVNNYAIKKKGINEFKLNLSKFIADTNQGKPIIFIIDELDRCRPNYAVSILEQIKHFFSVPKIVFVLSIDKIQLGNAVRGVYGSDKLDAEEYLRRFIDIEYSIPKPADDLYYKYLYEKLDFDNFINSKDRVKYGDFDMDKEKFIRISKVLFNNNNIPLRIQERIFISARLSLRSFKINNFLVPQVYLFLNYIKILHYDFYNNLKSKKLKLEEVQTGFLSIIEYNLKEENKRDLVLLEAYLLMFYNNYLIPNYGRSRLYETDQSSDDRKLLVRSIIEKDDNIFLNVITNIERANFNIIDLSIDHFFQKIDLLESVKI